MKELRTVPWTSYKAANSKAFPSSHLGAPELDWTCQYFGPVALGPQWAHLAWDPGPHSPGSWQSCPDPRQEFWPSLSYQVTSFIST